MRNDITEFALERQRSVVITLYPASTDLVDVINGVATGGFDLSPFVSSGRQSENDADLTMTWDGTGMFLANQPVAHDIIEIVEDGKQLWIGFVEQINTYHEERGSRVFQITCRSRDGVGPWRQRKITTGRFTQGTSLAAMAATIIESQGLSLTEYVVPLGGPVVPHDNVQLSDTTPWEALVDIGFAMGLTPITDARARIKFVSRDVDREADFVFGQEQVVRIEGSQGAQALTEFKLKWLDRNLTEVVQQEQVLASTSITAGFWKGEQDETLFWSDDRRARAKNTRMVVKQSINSGLLPIGDESYAQNDEFSGTVEVEVAVFVSGLATASLAAVLLLDVVGDKVVVGGFGVSTGITVPFGRVIRGFAEASLLLIMMSIGTGQYEILGEPFDFVHQVNTTTAFNDASPYWSDMVEEEENNLIYDEAHAQEVAVRELLHRTAMANSWDTVIIDDPRIEIGDIIELPDTSRLYVTSYQRDLTRGSASELRVSGFRS